MKRIGKLKKKVKKKEVEKVKHVDFKKRRGDKKE
jgi:hypothetical protein